MIRSPIFRSRVRGFSLMNVLILAIIVSALAIMAMRVFPTVNEYLTVVKAVNAIAKKARSAEEAKMLFTKQSDVEYSITSITAADLLITKQNEKMVISFAYNKEVPVVGPVYILIKYQGQSL